MNSLSGFIKLHRKLVAWGWYQDYVVKDVFLHLLLTANFKPTPWKGRILEEGQVVVGVQKLADELGFSRQQVRTALEKLKSTNEIIVESTNRYSVITIVNWREYQSETATSRFCDGFVNKRNYSKKSTNNSTKLATIKNDEINRINTGFFDEMENVSTKLSTNGSTNNQPTNNQQITNNQPQRKNGKNDKNVKNGKKREGTLAAHGSFLNVFLSDSEYNDLRTRYPQHYEAKIERLSRYLESTGKTYRNHYSTLLDWLEEDTAQEQPKKNSSYDVNELDKIDTLDWIE